MRVTIFGATGQVGKRLVRYALAEGHTIIAFGRNIEELIEKDLQSDKLEAIKGSVFDQDEVFEAVKGADVVLSALGGSFDGTDKTRSLGIKTIVKQMEKAGVKRILAVGGLGILSTPDGTFILDSPGYPAEYLPVGREHLKAFTHLKDSTLDWTYVCPPTIKDEDASDNYITSVTYPPSPNNNKIAAGDIAAFMILEVAQNKHVRERVGISAL